MVAVAEATSYIVVPPLKVTVGTVAYPLPAEVTVIPVM
jgi:hypothetical protein